VNGVRLAKASIYLGNDDVPFLVAETPSEAAEKIHRSLADPQSGLVLLTLANASDWNGKPLYVRAASVSAISPPKDQDIDEEDDDA
jgi:hypothetical protein